MNRHPCSSGFDSPQIKRGRERREMGRGGRGKEERMRRQRAKVKQNQFFGGRLKGRFR